MKIYLTLRSETSYFTKLDDDAARTKKRYKISLYGESHYKGAIAKLKDRI